MNTEKTSSQFIILAAFFGILIAINATLLLTGHLEFGKQGVGIMIASALTIGLYSFLYHDNPLFKMAEHIYVGVATAYIVVVDWYNILQPDVYVAMKDLLHKPFDGQVFRDMLLIVIPVTLGLLIYTRLSPKIGWLSRITFSIIVGFGAGLAIPNSINGYILEQIKPTMVNLWDPGLLTAIWKVPFWTAASPLIIFVGVISTLVYFFFSVEHKGFIGVTAKLGIWFLMISFGASFGYTVMARISLLIGRVEFLFKAWIPLIS
jgi:hypothetical protein